MNHSVSILTLENDHLRVQVVPRLGGKICSLLDKKTGHECFFQNPKAAYAVPELYDSFSDFDASGFDDAFPNIDESWSEINGQTVHFPDHGEVWSMPMTAQADEAHIQLMGESCILPYDYRKTVSIEGRSMRVHYAIRNTGTMAIPFMWTMHCLVNVDEHTRLILPVGADKAENVFAGGDLGELGALLDVNGTPDLRAMPAPGAMRKYYLANAVDEGLCGYEFPREGLRLMIRYDEKVLPYLGMWCTMGGFRGDINAALEPSSAYYDSIDTARERNRLPWMEAGEEVQFELLFTLCDMEGGQ
jgi:galactose mutarotase-like enzyme